MKNIFFLVIAIVLLPAPTIVMAAGVANTLYVDFVRVDASGKGYVNFTTPLQGTPAACATTPFRNSLAFNTNTAGGRAIMALVLTAKVTGNPVYAEGTGSCTVYGSAVEDWYWGEVVQ